MATKKKDLRDTIHETDIILNKDALANILLKKDLEYAELHEAIVDAYGLKLSYKGFMSLVSNQATWKLLYAWAVCEVLKVSIADIFTPIKVDIDKKVEEKEIWNERYGKGRKKAK